MTSKYQEILDTAVSAAHRAGHFLKETFYRRPQVEYKGEIDLVTERDRESQAIIQDTLTKAFPDHSIVAEEELDIQKDRERLWLVDPLDGTTNYAHGLPLFCVTMAFLEGGGPRAGVVYLPMLDETFHAISGRGAFLNGSPIRVSSQEHLGKSLLSTGFPYDVKESADRVVTHFKALLQRARGIRRLGAAAIDLAYLSCGRFDGFWEMGLQPWDTGAGSLLVREAGGRVSDFSGNPFDPFMKQCLASNGLIHEAMLSALNDRPI